MKKKNKDPAGHLCTCMYMANENHTYDPRHMWQNQTGCEQCPPSINSGKAANQKKMHCDREWFSCAKLKQDKCMKVHVEHKSPNQNPE